jgi:putative flippase GtrA
MLLHRHRRPLRFLAVGSLGLLVDIVLFTLAAMQGVHPLVAGFLALVAATLLTWRLNRSFTFARSGRHQGEEAMRYAAVTAAAQGTSYAVFAILTVTVLAALPQAAIIAGAAVGALISYNGQRLFAFAPPGASFGKVGTDLGFTRDRHAILPKSALPKLALPKSANAELGSFPQRMRPNESSPAPKPAGLSSDQQAILP